MQQKARLGLHFNLRSKRGETSLIYAVLNCYGKQAKIPTGLFVKPKHWDRKSENVLLDATYSKLDQHNNEVAFNIIYELRLLFHNFYLYFCDNPEIWGKRNIIINKIKNIMVEHLKQKGMTVKKIKAQPRTSVKVVEWLMRETEKDNSLKPKSKDAYIGKLRIVQRYEIESGVTLSDFTMINNDWLAEFYDWLINKYEVKGKGKVQTTTSNKTVDNLVRALKYAEAAHKLDIGYRKTLTINKLRTDNTKDEIALDDEQVLSIYNYECEGREAFVKDMFLIACFFGQRISDVGKIIESYKEMNGRGTFYLVQKKTTKPIEVVSLFKLGDEIVKKYLGKKIAIYSDPKEKSQFKDYDTVMLTQTFDVIIKRIAKKAGLTEKVYQIKQIGDRPTVVKQKEMWERIGSHTGRRTFVTLLSTRKWGLDNVMMYTGHDDISTIQKCYNKASAMACKKFKELPIEKRLRMYDDEEAATNNSLDEAYRETKNIDEYKQLLAFIGVDVCDYADLKRDYEFYRLFYKNEGKMLDAGINQDVVKQIWNSQNKTFKEKREALLRLIDEAKQMRLLEG